MISEHVIDHKFESIEDALNYVFQYEKTSLLSFDRICEILKKPNLYYDSKKQGLQLCSSISRRRISFALSTSSKFERAGSEKTCMWQLKPHNQLYLSDATIRSFIEQELSKSGPLSIDQIQKSSEIQFIDETVYHRFFNDNKEYFELANDGKYWFANQPIPQKKNFENINSALIYAMNQFEKGASIEEVNWFLCLSTINGAKSITRRSISRELSRRPDVFLHVSRARYILNKNKKQNEANAEDDEIAESLDFSANDDDFFDPSNFFNGDVFDFNI